MMKKSFSLVYLFLALALVFSPLAAHAQQSADKQAPPAKATVEKGTPQEGAMGQGAGRMSREERIKMMEEHRKEMQAKYDKALAEMKAMDEALDAKVAAMKAAKGDEKMAAMEAVIDLMATQRKEMRNIMAEVHHDGMCCMMMWHGPGGMKGMKDMSTMCPMMKDMQQGAQPPAAGAEKAKK